MKEIILNNWRAKVACLILATALWYLIRQNVERASTRFEFPRDRANETARLLPPTADGPKTEEPPKPADSPKPTPTPKPTSSKKTKP